MTQTELLEVLHKKLQNPKPRFRHQSGTVVKRTDGFYLRYYEDRDGVRTKVTERLCDLGTSPAKVKLLSDSHMSAINSERHTELHSATPAPSVTVGAFWETTYFPWVLANKRSSTIRGYESTWKLYVKPELETTPIETYTTQDACELLDYMVTVKNLNENTLAHIKSLCSGIFSKACGKSAINIKVNPWNKAAKASVKVRKAKAPVKYTREETAAILNVLTKPDAKLFFALCAVMGLRPSEVAAVKWEHMNWETNVYHVCEAAPNGVLGGVKSERSDRYLSVEEPVLGYLKEWYESCGKPSSGLMFANDNGEPVNSKNFARSRIAPSAKKACARWCGLYSGRHGAFTSLYNLTGDLRAAYQRSGNSLQVLMDTYVEPEVAIGEAGNKKFSEALLAAMGKAK
ncbi:MAG TPA: site-specific integrase [Candidatus Polarisedimenticolia bacterium]|nr:site-specific integrase [Candidatus Polarisedimenticolia bacterium]